MTGVLYGAGYPGPVTASEALAWYAGAPLGPVIGYLFAPRGADWFRWDAPSGEPHGPGDPRDLAGVFEMAATDGARYFRWMHSGAGAGTAVVMSEDARTLPPGDALPAGPARTRFGEPVRRLLAGTVTRSRDGWATLASARYAPCDVPVAAAAGERIWAVLAEYAVRDGHGNLSVVDTVLTGLTTGPAADVHAPARTGAAA